ncbi:MAG: hypothetical protein FWC48_04630, partial [Actinomycetia bacterium]|nr:hypothetical protein [Actinomycetes bacterium]
IHGSSTSQYWGMNAYMLGGVNDGMIATELPYQDARATDTTQAFTNSSLTAGLTWFRTGTTVNTAIGAVPTGLTAATYAAARSLLTGWTCSRAGCHVNSVFGNITWGQTYARRQGATSGSDTTSPMMMTTGHSSAPGAGNNHADSTCGPCHPGNPSGGYRLQAYNLAANGASRAYGCDQCHDAVGVATNSTAFPHGNRGIQMYQWACQTGPGTSAYAAPTTVLAASGNIWMYQSNIAQTGTGNTNTTMVDATWNLTQGATQGKNATLGAAEAGMIVDGSCLKCHVPVDAASKAAYGVTTLNAYHHSVPATWPTDINQMNPYSGSTVWMYLWK